MKKNYQYEKREKEKAKKKKKEEKRQKKLEKALGKENSDGSIEEADKYDIKDDI